MALEIQALQDDFEKQSYFIRLRELTEFDMQVEQPKEERKACLLYTSRFIRWTAAAFVYRPGNRHGAGGDFDG